MKKGLLFLTFVMVFCVALTFTSSINAASKYGIVSDNTQVDTLHMGDSKLSYDISNNGQEEVTITYDSASLKLLPEGEDDRPADYAWLGIKVKSPDGMTKYSIQCNDGEKKDKNMIPEGGVTEYFGINYEMDYYIHIKFFGEMKAVIMNQHKL